MKTILPVENGNTLAALQGFLKSLLQNGVVEALLVPLRTPYGSVSPALVIDPQALEAADPLAPVLPVSGATLAGRLSVKEPRARIGVLLRSCELRALVELTKMQQASLENLTLITYDCAGAYSVPVYQRLSGQANGGAALWTDLYRSLAEQPSASHQDLRQACQMCEQPVYPNAQVTLELYGADLASGIPVSLPDDMAEKLGIVAAGSEDFEKRRAAVMEPLIAARTADRDAAFLSIRQRLEGEEGIPGIFSACIRCHNCMNVCPICYCKVCVFRSAIFDHEPMQFVHWAQQKGACRMPTDTVLFHLTRLNHMDLSCVGCGMCTEACPAELPVGLVFRAVGQRLQAAFEYVPGRDPEEPLPLVTFKADEWTQVGE